MITEDQVPDSDTLAEPAYREMMNQLESLMDLRALQAHAYSLVMTGAPDSDQLQVLNTFIQACLGTKNVDCAADAAKHVLAIYRRNHDRERELGILQKIGLWSMSAEDFETGLAALGESVELSRELKRPLAEATRLYAIGQIWKLRGQEEDARQAFRGAVELYRSAGRADLAWGVIDKLSLHE